MRWEQRVEVPLLVLTAAFIVAYAWIVIDSQIPPTLEAFLRVVSWTTWAAFAVEFVIRICLARRRLRYVVRHWYDVLLVALPMFRPLRALRLVGMLRVLDRVFQRRLIGRTGVYIVVIAVFCIVFGALGVLDAERGAAGASITTLPDALWFAFATTTTVGYNDMTPVTSLGRLIAGALMVARVTLLGAVTATMAAWLMSAMEDRRREQAEAEEQAKADEH